MKYIIVSWPEIQDYMNNSGYPNDCLYDSEKNVWAIPENWEPDYLEVKENVFRSLMEE